MATSVHTLINPISVVNGTALNALDLLSNKHEIPPYQRDYVWTKPIVKQLWQDLITHYKKHSSHDDLHNPEGYFLGAMVTIQANPTEPFEVVDGQQRLTTLASAVSVLYDLISTLPEPLRIGYEENATRALASYIGAKWVPNLEFGETSICEFFLESSRLRRSKILKEDYWNSAAASSLLKNKKSSASRMKDAFLVGYEQINAFLDECSDSAQRQKRLIAFFRLVTECVVVLRISASSHNSAYAIFESLNNKGVKLSQGDLIKNALMKYSSDSERSDIVDKWNNAKQAVEGDDFISMPEFLHYSFLSRYSAIKASELLESVKEIVSEPISALNYASEIEKDADAYKAITCNFESSWTQPTTMMLKDLRTAIGIKLAYPALIAAHREYSSNAPLFEKHVRLIMNFVFRYMKILGESVEGLAKIISETSALIRTHKDLSEISTSLKKHVKDDDVRREFIDISFPETKLAYFTVYYLEKQRLHGTGPLEHGVLQNLEHIMPKTPTESHWPAANHLKQTDPDEFKDYLWRIGNLLPLPEGINKSIKNKNISHKIDNGTANSYSSASLTLVSPKEIVRWLDGENWTLDSIKNRQIWLAENVVCGAWEV